MHIQVKFKIDATLYTYRITVMHNIIKFKRTTHVLSLAKTYSKDSFF